MESPHPLLTIAENVRQEAARSRVAVVFDLDSTLFCVSSRTQHILRQLGHDPTFATQFAEPAEILRSIEVLPSDYSVREVIARTQLKPSEELGLAIRNYWRKHFFASHFLDKDILYPSANEYVNALRSLGAEILYLTGRNHGSMREGTLRALYHHGFPLFNETMLHMKPSDLQSDENYKVTVLKELVHDYDHIWFFENEPVIIAEVRMALPQIHIVFVKSAHSGKAAEPLDLPTITPDYKIGLPTK
ncbi:MAG: HAD family hydrolase [Bdellovibrionales bacterium]|nr:HAD family hydrolase [Bdellovibrionales bacterium]